MSRLTTNPHADGRFLVRKKLGAGSMGIVYEAVDRERDEVVALKTLINSEAADLYRFKQEFRTLADIHHPNLVNLHELFAEEDRCYFTMERIRGWLEPLLAVHQRLAWEPLAHAAVSGLGSRSAANTHCQTAWAARVSA